MILIAKRVQDTDPRNKPCSFSVTRVCGTRPSPFARKFTRCRSFLDEAPRRFSAAARALRKPSSGPRRLTLHNAQSHLPDHVRHRRLLRRPRARPRLRRAGASSGPRPSLARPADRLYRFAARRVARLFARARTSDRRLLFPVTHEPPTLQPKRSTACRAAAKETSVKAEDFKCPLACDASKEADGAVVEMAKAKCVHPERPVAKACKDCPRK